MRRFTLPVFSFLDHTVFDRELSAHYGDRDLADLPINGFAVSTNLSRNRLHVHRTGPIWHAVRSSGAIPGVLPPFVDRSGEMFVDGALIDNLPLSTMRDIKLGPNVVAGFFDDESRQRHLRYDEIPGRERLIGDIVMRRRRTFPGILNVLTRSMMVTSRRSVSELEIGSDCLMRLPRLQGHGHARLEDGTCAGGTVLPIRVPPHRRGRRCGRTGRSGCLDRPFRFDGRWDFRLFFGQRQRPESTRPERSGT